MASVMSTHTLDQTQWLKMRDDAKAGKTNAAIRFNNSALTVDGQLCIGMTYSIEWRRYSCTYLQTNGVRDFGAACSWDEEGGSMDGLSDLNLKTIQDGIRTI